MAGLVTAFRQARVVTQQHARAVAAVKDRINPLGRVVVDHTRGCTETGLVGYHGTNKQFWENLHKTEQVVEMSGLFVGSLQTAVAYAEQHGNNAVILAVNAKDKDIPTTDVEDGFGAHIKLQPGATVKFTVFELNPSYPEQKAELRDLAANQPSFFREFFNNLRNHGKFAS